VPAIVTTAFDPFFYSFRKLFQTPIFDKAGTIKRNPRNPFQIRDIRDPFSKHHIG